MPKHNCCALTGVPYPATAKKVDGGVQLRIEVPCKHKKPPTEVLVTVSDDTLAKLSQPPTFDIAAIAPDREEPLVEASKRRSNAAKDAFVEKPPTTGGVP